MGKYQPLARFLDGQPRDKWAATFAEIEEVLNFELPPSARKHQAWWSNSTRGNHSQSKGWLGAGWFVAAIDLKQEKVWFERGRSAGATEITSELQDLWQDARTLSGIDDRESLERAVVQSYIRREAAKKLIELGGSMPDFEAPPRRRIPA